MNILSVVSPKLFTGLSVLFSFLLSCNPKPTSNHDNSIKKESSRPVFTLISPKRDFVAIKGQPISIQIKAAEKAFKPDSALVYLGSTLVKAGKDSSLNLMAPTDIKKLGKQNLRIVVYYS